MRAGVGKSSYSDHLFRLRFRKAPGGTPEMSCRLKLSCSAFSVAALLVGGYSSPALAAPYDHVLILSIDGLRESDLNDPVTAAYLPHITAFEHSAIHYSNAHSVVP